MLPSCRDNNVTVIAYGSLASALSIMKSYLGTDILREDAETKDKTLAQVALNWCTVKDKVIAIPKSGSVHRTQEKWSGRGWALT